MNSSNTSNMQAQDRDLYNQWQAQQMLANRRQQDMNMLGLASKVDSNTMLGYALGKQLKNLFNIWQDNYRQRGKDKETATMETANAINGSSDLAKEATVWNQLMKNNELPSYENGGGMYLNPQSTKEVLEDYPAIKEIVIETTNIPTPTSMSNTKAPFGSSSFQYLTNENKYWQD